MTSPVSFGPGRQPGSSTRYVCDIDAHWPRCKSLGESLPRRFNASAGSRSDDGKMRRTARRQPGSAALRFPYGTGGEEAPHGSVPGHEERLDLILISRLY
jgi:hypothetical protein